jgi:hypothetical protein
MSTIYINTPFERSEHDAIADLARQQGRSKGQQLRALALEAMKKHGLLSTPTTGSTRRAPTKRRAQSNINHA